MKQKEEKLIARKNKYLKYLSKYPVYSTLLILKEYEDKELYEECEAIKKALDEYNLIGSKEKDAGVIVFPTHLSGYESELFQNKLKKLGVKVERAAAKEKADLIKANLPVR